MTFDFHNKVRQGLPAPAEPYKGFPDYYFVGGNNDPNSLDVDSLIKASQTVLEREGKTLATYCLESGPQGYLPLREFLVKKLSRYSSINCEPENIMLTSGSLQAIDLINEVILSPGDTVIVEESNYGGVLSRLKNLGVHMVTVPVDRQGMQTEKLAQVLEQLDNRGVVAKYIYSIPTVHNPTGSIMSEKRRVHLLELAVKYDIPVFEDECYADLVWDGKRPPSLYSLDQTGRVIHVGSFSKTIAPALRVGYIVADWSLLSHLLKAKIDAGSGALEQMVLAEYCNDHFDQHLITLNANLKRKLDVLIEVLNREFGSSAEFEAPPGGIFLWLRLPDSVSTAQLCRVASAEGIEVNPGHEWSLEGNADKHIRICFASPDSDVLVKGIEKLADICFKEFGVPEFGANKKRR